MQKILGDYDQALLNFIAFSSRYRGRELRDAVNTEILGCQEAKKLKADSMNVVITHLPDEINKGHIELSPLLKDENTLIYASLREDELKYYDDEEKKPVRKFYIAKNEEGKWVYQSELEGIINNEEFNTGNGAFSPDGMRFYFSRCKVNWKNKVRCEIYVSEVSDNIFSEPVKVNTINDPIYSSTQPTVGLDVKKGRDILYFASNRPRGEGGYDIWYSIYDRQSNIYSRPQNASRLNTSGDEITPFYDLSSHKIYFSSDGWPGLGGMDIFEAIGEQSKWTTPANIGYPVNTSFDEQYYIISKNKTDGFFTSNRPGGKPLQNPTCCDDIYSVIYKDKVILNLSGRVYGIEGDSLPENVTSSIDYIKKHLLQEAVVTLNLITKEFAEPVIISTDTTNEKGQYNFELENNRDYQLVTKKDGYFLTKINYSTRNADVTKRQISKPIGLKKISMKPIRLQNIYYQYDKWHLTDEAKETIDTTLLIILNDLPELIVEISAHTDSKGDEDYNDKLSQKRAESVVSYLIRQDIDKKRLIAKGYGEGHPIAPNEFADGTDNPDGRTLNRRTEFRVIGSTDEKSVFYVKIK
ncbi:MAG: OmpA family protein [Bacteroidia bacterium]|nr:OmpA family protein [Bacteroidia bacterium]